MAPAFSSDFALRTPADRRTLFSLDSPNRPRAFAALCASALATLICLREHHFTLLLSQPETFVIMTKHRCGCLLILCATWAAVECLRLPADR